VSWRLRRIWEYTRIGMDFFVLRRNKPYIWGWPERIAVKNKKTAGRCARMSVAPSCQRRSQVVHPRQAARVRRSRRLRWILQ